MTGDQLIAAPRADVWRALNDPDVLRQCIPGCQSLEKESDTQLKATVEIKIGPIGARFAGAVTLSDLDPPNGYMISGTGQGGVVGFAKGGAKVRLADDSAGTRLRYEVDAEVGGRLAQLGGPIIDATAKQLAGKFFDTFGAIVGGEPAGASSGAVASSSAKVSSAAPSHAPATRPVGAPVVWVLAIIVAAFAGFFVGRSQGAAGSDWAGLAMGLLVTVVAAAAFAYGRMSATPVITLDAAALRRLIAGDDR